MKKVVALVVISTLGMSSTVAATARTEYAEQLKREQNIKQGIPVDQENENGSKEQAEAVVQNKKKKQALTVGYTQSKVKGESPRFKGVNVKYLYEFDDKVGIKTSFSYIRATEHEDYSAYSSDDLKFQQYTVAVGPSYQINEFVSFYGLVGVGFNNLDITETGYWGIGENANFARIKESYKKSAAVYGAGVQFNLTELLAVDLGYEGTRFKFPDAESSVTFNAFNVGIGYRF